MRLLIVTSQFPIAGEPNRGRPLHQTIGQLAELATVKVISPIACYPRWARPRSYIFREPGSTAAAGPLDAHYVQYPALPLVSRPFNGWLCGRALQQSIGSFRPDLILGYWLYPDAYGAMLAAHRAGLPFVAGARGSDLRVRDWLSRRLTRPVVRAAGRLLVVSKDLGRVATAEYGADPARVRVIPNGCDASLFRPGDRRAARAALGVDQEAQLVVYVGRLVAEKGLLELLAAFETLRPTVPRLRLALVGEGPMHAGLSSRIAGMAPGLVTLAGAQPATRVAQWMTASDLVTLPSYSEGHPNVLVEALACGRPVVATRVGGIPEVVDDACGALVPPKDAAALAQALLETLDRDWNVEALGRRFSRGWRQVASDTLAACEEALSERHATGTRTQASAAARPAAHQGH